MSLRIKEICKEKNLTLGDLADKMEIKRESLSRAINGKPNLETLEKIATALDVQVWELFTTSTSKEELTALVDHRGQLYRASSVQELEKIIEEIKKAAD